MGACPDTNMGNCPPTPTFAHESWVACQGESTFAYETWVAGTYLPNSAGVGLKKYKN